MMIHYNKPWFWMVCFILLNAILILSSSLLPFVDLPNHLAEATIYKYYGDAGNQFSSYYQLVPWYFPNQFHIWFCSLNIFSSIEAGNKAFYILYISLLPAAVYLIVKELRGNLWYAILSLTFIYGYNVTFGFAGYTIAIPVVFLLFYFMILDFRLDKLYLKVVLAVLLVVLFTMHAQVALFGALIYGFCSLYHYRKSFLKITYAFIVTLPLVALIINWWVLKDSEAQHDTLGYLLNYYSSTYFTALWERLGLPLYENFQLAEGVAGKLIALLLTLLILLPVFLDYRKFIEIASKYFTKDSYVYVSILLLISFCCFFFLPNELPGQSPISERFSIFFWLSFIIFASLYLPDFTKSYQKGYVIFAILVYTVFWADYFISFNRINNDFNKQYFQGIDNTSRLSGLIFDYQYRGRSVYLHFQNYFIVWEKGIASTKIIDYRFGIVNRNVSKDLLPEHYDWDWKNSAYLESLPYKNVDLLLVRGNNPTRESHLERFVPIDQKTPWELYRNNAAQELPEVILKEVMKPWNVNK